MYTGQVGEEWQAVLAGSNVSIENQWTMSISVWTDFQRVGLSQQGLHPAQERMLSMTCQAISCFGYPLTSLCDGKGRWVYSDQDWARIASLARTVLACAQSGDAVAAGIVSRACDDLVEAAAAVVVRCHFPGLFPLILSGTAFACCICFMYTC